MVVTLAIQRPRCQDLIDPLAVGVPHPTLSWVVSSTGFDERQVACDLEVARDADFTELVWAVQDLPTEQPWLRYGGPPLLSRESMFWRVRVLGPSGQVSPWSDPARFGTGLFEPADWSAHWITHPDWLSDADPVGLPLLTREFAIDGPIASARLYVAGLGVYVPSLNGTAVTDAVLEPPYSDFATTVDYTTHDVTAQLRDGINVLGIKLGTGIAHVTAPPDRYTKFAATIARPRALAQLEIVRGDGSVDRLVSDQSWQATLGPTRRSHWYGGEEYDARLADPQWDQPAGDRTGWTAAVEVSWPVELIARSASPIRVVEAVPTVEVTRPADGIRVFDLGVNLAGWPKLRLTTTPGHKISIWPGELLDEQGLVNQKDIGTPVFSTYTTTEGEQEWHPEFMYHGFRYLEVHGLPDDAPDQSLSGLVLRADNEKTGSFTCSDELLQGIHDIIDRAVRSNMYSVITDCPHREKLGWLEQIHLLFSVVSHGYDVPAYYRDLIRRIAAGQQDNGLVPDIAPEYVVFEKGFRDDPNWGAAIILAPWQLYRAYGDVETLRIYYPAMRRYLAYLHSRADEGILDHGLGDWYSLQDPPPRAAVATWGYLRATDALARIAAVLGHEADAAEDDAEAERIRAAFHQRFFDGEESYGSGQAVNALALDMDAVPTTVRAAVAKRLATSISSAGDHLLVGEVTLPAVLRALSAAGYDELIHSVATRTDWPSYGYQLEHGATSLTEAWDGPTTGASQNHFMLGAIDDWFVRRVAGIDQTAESIAYRRALIRPMPVGDVASAAASIMTPYGRLASSWSRNSERLTLEVEIPVGAEAEIQLPAGWNWTPRPPADGAVQQVGSGRWRFTGLSPTFR